VLRTIFGSKKEEIKGYRELYEMGRACNTHEEAMNTAF
jgi:hypothetical protein